MLAPTDPARQAVMDRPGSPWEDQPLFDALIEETDFTGFCL